MQLSGLYRKEFKILSDTAFRVCRGLDVPYPESYAIYLAKSCENIPKRNCFTLSKEDITQQLELIWCEASDSFRRKSPRTTFRSYLIRYGTAGLRDWIRKQFKTAKGKSLIFEGFKVDKKLSLVWLLNGTKEYPWSELSAYERYLLYMRFARDLTMREMSVILKTYRDGLSVKLDSTVCKLRRLLNEN